MIIQNNTSFLEAGAIFLSFSTEISMKNMIFKYNKSNKNGGAIIICKSNGIIFN